MNEEASNYDPDATIDSGNCTIPGCTTSGACNYNPNANSNDGSCDFFSCLPSGCINPQGCNYDPDAIVADDCTFPELGYDCDGNCLEDSDGDGICDPFEIAGCTDPTALNYDETATDDDGSCEPIVEGCMNAQACNYNSEANVVDSSCEFT